MTLPQKPITHTMHRIGQKGIVAKGVHVGKNLIAGAARHPLLLFSLGAVAGIYLCKKRQISAAPAKSETETIAEKSGGD